MSARECTENSQTVQTGKGWPVYDKQLSVRVEEIHIRGSPLMEVTIERLGTQFKIIAKDEVSKPWGVAVRDNGKFVVAEWGGDCVSMFSDNGIKLGSALGQFKSPHGVTFDAGVYFGNLSSTVDTAT